MRRIVREIKKAESELSKIKLPQVTKELREKIEKLKEIHDLTFKVGGKLWTVLKNKEKNKWTI